MWATAIMCSLICATCVPGLGMHSAGPYFRPLRHLSATNFECRLSISHHSLSYFFAYSSYSHRPIYNRANSVCWPFCSPFSSTDPLSSRKETIHATSSTATQFQIPGLSSQPLRPVLRAVHRRFAALAIARAIQVEMRGTEK